MAGSKLRSSAPPILFAALVVCVGLIDGCGGGGGKPATVDGANGDAANGDAASGDGRIDSGAGDVPPSDSGADAAAADGGANDGGTGADAGSTDAPPTATVAGVIDLADVTLVDPAAAAVGGVQGGSIAIAFGDLTDGNGGVALVGTSAIGGCLVLEYDPTHLPNRTLDAAAITIANSPGNESPATGLLTTVGPCTFVSAAGRYLCISNSGTNQAVTAVGGNTAAPGTVELQFATPFTGESLVGSHLRINGFATAAYNSGASTFPIVAQPAANTLIVLDQAGTTAPPEVSAGGITDVVLNGLAPVPLAGSGAAFLGTGSIAVSKPANAVWPALSTTVDVPGQGWSLSDAGDPTMLPLAGTATDVVFGCGNGSPGNSGDDTCGDGSTAPVTAMIVSGRATRQSVSGLAAYEMPTETPGTDTWLDFRCSAIGAHSVTLTRAALQAIIDFTPTRVETRVQNVAVAILNDGLNSTTLLAGHAIVGHTSAP
jgi:hypothetical protein